MKKSGGRESESQKEKNRKRMSASMREREGERQVDMLNQLICVFFLLAAVNHFGLGA